MPKKKQKTRKDEELEDDVEETEYTRLGLKKGTQEGIIATLFFLVALFFLLSAIGLAGNAGDFIYEKFLRLFFGYGFILVPLLLITLGVVMFRDTLHDLKKRHWFSALFLVIGTLGFLELIFKNTAGGLVGKIARPFVNLFDIYVSILIFVAIVVVSILVLFETKLGIPSFLRGLFTRSKREDDYYEEYELEEDYEDEEFEEDEAVEEDGEPDEEEEETPKKAMGIFGLGNKKIDDSIEMETATRLPTTYTPPPLSLLGKSKGRPAVGDIKANANLIKRTLQNFGIDVEMDEVSIGPTVARYALKPAEGVKLSRIVGLQNDLALALAAHPIRIEAPIPGKSLVGIEIPNKTKSTVGLASLLAEPEFKNSSKPLMVSLGKGVTGKAYYANIAKMPHVLIAGATGSGKSVTVHNLIVSLLYRNGPQDLRFIMVDPKRVELTLYNKIPHLLTPVIKDPKKAILALKWAAKEMERRYDILESESCRDIQSYHQTVVEPAYAAFKENGTDEDEVSLPERMPYIVIIIDELADIMQTYPRELESGIVRLAQMSRAVGIHLIISTQRPSVNVVTGLIKANIPARIALQVASQVDSKTILDTVGAEKLLGAGDMLFLGGDMSKPARMQSAFVSEDEVKKIVKYIIKNHEEELVDEISLTDAAGSDKTIFSATLDDDEEEDELYDEAKETVVAAGKASTSYLQRKLKVGYSRAARLMDILEENGVIGPANGSKPREVLLEENEPYGEGADEEPDYEAAADKLLEEDEDDREYE